MRTRLAGILVNIGKRLKSRRDWLWILLVDLVKDRYLAAINGYLDTHATGAFGFAVPVLRWFVTTPFGISLVVLTTVIVAVILHAAYDESHRNPVQISSYEKVTDEAGKLVIHRAVYAAGLQTEVSVTDKLQKSVRDALVIPIDSTLGNLLPRDPAFNVRKRLDVDYSYGSDTVSRISRMEPPPGEIGRLLLPEDSEIQRLANEVTQLTQQLGAVKSAKALPNDPAGQVLRAMAEDDAEKIQQMVRRTGCRVEFHFDSGSDPYMDVIIDLINYSVFEVVTFGEIEGYTMYAGEQLALNPQIVDTAGKPFLSLKRGHSGSLRIHQFISANVADLMWSERDRKVPVDLRNVVIDSRCFLLIYQCARL